MEEITKIAIRILIGFIVILLLFGATFLLAHSFDHFTKYAMYGTLGIMVLLIAYGIGNDLLKENK